MAGVRDGRRGQWPVREMAGARNGHTRDGQRERWLAREIAGASDDRPTRCVKTTECPGPRFQSLCWSQHQDSMNWTFYSVKLEHHVQQESLGGDVSSCHVEIQSSRAREIDRAIFSSNTCPSFNAEVGMLEEVLSTARFFLKQYKCYALTKECLGLS